ncbi:MAG TPA: HD domain-containing protein [Candidatus Saccharimonadales bacterium]
MTEADIIEKTRIYAEETLKSDTTGHDWWHVYRVWKLSLQLAKDEKGANLFIVQLGALLHDIADWKFTGGDLEVGPRKVKEWLDGLGVDPDVTEQVVYIVRHISFRGGTNTHKMQSLEGRLVQDADRLDAIGAIGVARVFTFGGAMGREMYDPNHKPHDIKTFEDYKNQVKDNTSVNHFYEKLLLLKDRMNTDAGRRFAQERHDYMERFLDEFYAEWEGKR